MGVLRRALDAAVEPVTLGGLGVKATPAASERFLVDVEHRLLSRSYVAPTAGRLRVEDYAKEWVARRRAG